MSEEILMNVTPMESRVALVENGVLREVFIERERNRGIVGNIYYGKVVRVLPGMQAAFVDIGLEKSGFMHVRDIFSFDKIGGNKSDLDIRQLVHEGQSILVQVIKDPLGTKGARIGSYLSIASRNLVYTLFSNKTGVSNLIDDAERRNQLKEWLDNALSVVELEREVTENERKADKVNAQATSGGYIIRTAAESIGEQDFIADIRYLKRLWRALERKMVQQVAPSLIYTDLQLCERTVRDLVYPELEKIRIDSSDVYERMVSFTQEFVPEITDKLEYYSSDRPIFDLFGVEEEINKALNRKVQLKSGGYLIIDQTEAMTTIDVNTGAYVGKRNQDETIFKTNLEAATTLARQIRLRNLGGIIIVDFIDMNNEDHRRQVLRILSKEVEKDKTKTYIGEFSGLGLIEMTRKRTRESLEHVLCETCVACSARGSLRSAETVCSDIFREIVREARAYDNDRLLVLASQSVVDRLLDEDSEAISNLQSALAKSIHFQVEPVYTQEQYDVVLL